MFTRPSHEGEWRGKKQYDGLHRSLRAENNGLPKVPNSGSVGEGENRKVVGVSQRQAVRQLYGITGCKPIG